MEGDKAVIDGIPVIERGGLNVLDFKNPKLYERRHGSVALVPLRGDKLLTVTVRSWTDSKTNITYGIPLGGKNEDGTPKFRKIRINGARYYNLAIASEAMEWAVMQHHECVQGSKLYKGYPLLKIFDGEEEAAATIDKARKGAENIVLANNMEGMQLFDFARIIGKNPDGQTEIMVKGMVIQYALDKPAEFARLYNSNDRGVLEVIKRAESYKMIKFYHDRGYLWLDQTPLGLSTSNAVEFLKKERNLLQVIDQESKLKEEQTKQGIIAQQKENPYIADPQRTELTSDERAELEAFRNSQKASTKVDVEESLAATPPPEYFQGRAVSGVEDAWTYKELQTYAAKKGYDEDEWSKSKCPTKTKMVAYLRSKEEVTASGPALD